jgi:rubrerythrin
MSAVVYARVPETLKQALQRRAAERGLTLTQALVELVERGFEAIADEHSVRELEGKLAAATSELAQTRGRLQEAELNLRAAREREQLTARTYSALAERSRQELASCPRCRKPVRGCDLLVRGRCPHCNKPLSSLLLPAPRANLDSNEYQALLGALGVLVGLAIAASADSAG